MGHCLKPNTVYMTNPKHLGVVIFQPVNGNIQLFGTNVIHYNNIKGKKEVIIPSFDELICITEDWMMKDTVNPMTGLTNFIGFITDNPETEIWINNTGAINETKTPTFSLKTGQ